jgi:hypothetical protein
MDPRWTGILVLVAAVAAAVVVGSLRAKLVPGAAATTPPAEPRYIEVAAVMAVALK